MKKIVLSLIALTLCASPLWAQSLEARLAQAEENNKALANAVARVEADVATIKMNQSAHGAVLDSLVVKVDKLMKAAPAASHAWANSPPQMSVIQQSYAAPQMMRAGLFGRRMRAVAAGGGTSSASG